MVCVERVLSFSFPTSNKKCFALCDVSFTDMCVGAGVLFVDPSCLLNDDVWTKMEAANFLSSSHRIFLVECKMRTKAVRTEYRL